MFANWFFKFHCFAVEIVDFSGFFYYETLCADAIAEVDDCGGHFGLSFLVWLVIT